MSMTPLEVTEQERAIIRDLRRIVAQRDEAETAATRQYKSERAVTDRKADESLADLARRLEVERRAIEDDREAASAEAQARFDDEAKRAEREYRGEKFRVGEQADHDEKAARKAWDEARWTADTVYEAKEGQPREEFEKAAAELKKVHARLAAIEGEAGNLLSRFHQRGVGRAVSQMPPREGSAEGTAEATKESLDALVEACGTHLRRLRRGFFSRTLEGVRPFLIFALPVLAAGALLGLATEWKFDQFRVKYAVGGGAAGLVLLIVMAIVGRRQSKAALIDLRESLATARRMRERLLVAASEKRAFDEAELKRQRDADVEKARETYAPRIAKVRAIRQRLLEEIEQKHAAFQADLARRRELEAGELAERFALRRRELEERAARDAEAARSSAERRRVDLEAKHGGEWTALESAWRDGMGGVRQRVEALEAAQRLLFLPWTDDAWRTWTPPVSAPPFIRFGVLDVNLEMLPGGVPRDERLLDVGPLRFSLPAVLDFPTRASLLVESKPETSVLSVSTIQNVMLRLLTALPAGKVRFTIIDPVGLGQNFAGFMHLADYEESFVADRIWTETRHIEQRLTDLTEHMENVIQKYLRNDFETITQYNEQAGEIAEPFRFLVIANFPVNFSETAARRLVSIIDSGPRCGVYTLMTVDTRQALPRGVEMADLRKNGVTIGSERDRVCLLDDDLKPLPLSLDAPPAADALSDLVHRVGRAAKDSTRVEVPFEHVVPVRDRFWSFTSEREVSAPLGRAGATKLQSLTLGRGIAQHMLVAGKTGSGKSTLLHVLVTNLSLHYRPDEVEFYLVDFKKGVEFKTYASHNLPHARVIAIESDREFGLSVLQRVDAELRRRGEIFRSLGAQDLAAYRRAGQPERLPRTLLIIDEFQEFFVEDDKIAQDAGLLLDRLVRQGRAFGIHVILGSQTLAGAYSLARSTMGQMAVRVALQCSEADAMVIMGDDNTAARLLSRPGEAIYNDQGGLVEGNSPFQIVWLPEDVRDRYLGEVERLTREGGYRPPEPMIVFEGNVPADVRRNAVLGDVIEAGPRDDMRAAPRAWLGEAIAIKDPTAAVLRRQSGCNLLMVGQRDEAALAMQAVAMVGLAAQHPCEPPDGASFYVLDGTLSDGAHAGYLAAIARHLPHDVQIVAWHDVEHAIAEIAAELERRQSGHLTDTPPVVLLINGLQRFRMLRQEEEFGFASSSDAGREKSAASHFGAILRDGPPYGIHTIAWCDTANNLARALDRKTLREFDLRVLFQMSSTDSSNLIDSPAASMLGTQRALLHSEDHGIFEKFRPYALPDAEWLRSVGASLRSRAGDAV
jgi:S-DNA-T family DNA segregation ATPase FtsK/SpoIIIE